MQPHHHPLPSSRCRDEYENRRTKPARCLRKVRNSNRCRKVPSRLARRALIWHGSSPLERKKSIQYPPPRARLLRPCLPQAARGNVQKVMALHAGEKIGRNDPCPCGRGRKYKHCCLRSDTPSVDSLWTRQHEDSARLNRERMRLAARKFGERIHEAWQDFVPRIPKIEPPSFVPRLWTRPLPKRGAASLKPQTWRGRRAEWPATDIPRNIGAPSRTFEGLCTGVYFAGDQANATDPVLEFVPEEGPC